MIFTPLALPGAFSIELERRHDERGYFARSFCEEEFRARGLPTRVAQCNVSFNSRAGTLRGMHYQVAPHAEAKLIRVTRGSISDVIVDLRPDSLTRLQWCAVELTQDNGRMLFVPEGFAHGFQTLAENTEVFYQMFENFHPECARGVRWDDPALKIQWPAAVERIISQKDHEYALLSERGAEGLLR